jgi:arylsulfatase A-like enzyme
MKVSFNRKTSMAIRAASPPAATGLKGRRSRAVPAVILALTAISGLSGCAGPHYVRSGPLDPASVTPPAVGVTRNVVLVSIDGLRPDAIDGYATPTLRRLVREGSYSLSARTIMPSKTLPSHTSMLSGEPPDQHGVLWNTAAGAKVDVVEFSTVFSVARAHGYRTAAFFSKSKFSPLQRPGTLDYSQAPGGWFGRWSSERTVGDVRAHLEIEAPNLLFVHLSDPDRAGHDNGWMSAAYGRAVEATDAALGELLSAADRSYGTGNYSVLVTADHGGHEYDHGSSDSRDVTIPWIAWGRGVRPGALTGVRINTFDTAPTVLWLLGVQEPDSWDGSPVLEAFQPRISTQTF